MTVDKQGLEAAMNAPLDERVEHPRIWLEPAGAPDRCWCSDNQWGDEGVEYVLAASPSPSEMDVVAEAIYNADFRVGTWAEWAEIDEEEPANKRLKDQYRAYATAALSGAQSALAAMRAERDEAIERGYEWFNLAQDYKAIVLDAEARLKALEEQVEADANALDEAAVEVQSWGAYAGEYFQNKHDLEGCCRTITRQATAARTALKENAQ